jgi:hypothetical protein
MSQAFLKRLCMTIALTCAPLMWHATSCATSLETLTAIEAQRQVLAQDKKIIFDQFQTASKLCWQKFAVNDCLANARREKYQQLAPLDAREIELNTRQRELKEFERQQRLSDKATGKGSP